MIKNLRLVLPFLLFVQISLAQQSSTKLITVDFKDSRLKQVVDELEAQSGYFFYYDLKQTDSLRITLHISKQPLEMVLKLAFENTDFQFVIDKNHRIFLTRGRQIRLEPANRFLKTAPGHLPQDNQESSIASFTNDKEKKIPEATTENKLYEIGIKTNNIPPGNSLLTGYILNRKTGEALAGASISAENIRTAVATDQFGYFAITLPRGRHTLHVRGLGMRDTRRQLILYSDGKLNIDMQEQINSLREVYVSASKVANVQSVESGLGRLAMREIKQIPTAFGEPDVLKVVLTLPGVTSVGEATTGFNVRGGAADENLILLDGATIYNPAHFFGFFAAFNPDIVKDIELYKSSIPEKFGGRLSSVLEINNREGNKKIFTGSAGIGLLTGRFNIEGPIIKDKTSFIFGARTTYSDWLLHLLPEAYKHSSASFNDFNLGISHQIDDRNNLYLSAYLSNDKFKLNSDTGYSYSNKSLILKWKHNFNSRLFSLISAGVDKYQYEVSSSANPVNAFDLHFKINQSNLKGDFTYYVNNQHTLSFGLNSLLYHIDPGTLQPNGRLSLVLPETVPREQALESAFYLGDTYVISPGFTIEAGVRYNVYNYLGPQTIDHYTPGLPKSDTNVQDSSTYGGGHFIHTYTAPDFRISARYLLTEDLSLKAAYNKLHQYIHLLSNSTSISPTDVYKLSDPNIKPQHGNQVSLGLFKNLDNNTIEMSFEVYYKQIRDYLDYKSSALLLLNQHIERDVINTRGKAYGAEFLLKKTAGKLNGWISYTYSRTLLKQDDPFAGEQINNGNYYPANYDKPHIFNLTSNYKFTHRYSVSVDVSYSTGRPITLPIAKYDYQGSDRVFYSDRNAYRIPDYFRTDFSINIEGNHKVHQRTHNSWNFGVYNITGHKNAYSVFFTEQGGTIGGYKLSIFAAPIPYINYNIRF